MQIYYNTILGVICFNNTLSAFAEAVRNVTAKVPTWFLSLSPANVHQPCSWQGSAAACKPPMQERVIILPYIVKLWIAKQAPMLFVFAPRILFFFSWFRCMQHWHVQPVVSDTRKHALDGQGGPLHTDADNKIYFTYASITGEHLNHERMLQEATIKALTFVGQQENHNRLNCLCNPEGNLCVLPQMKSRHKHRKLILVMLI